MLGYSYEKGTMMTECKLQVEKISYISGDLYEGVCETHYDGTEYWVGSRQGVKDMFEEHKGVTDA